MRKTLAILVLAGSMVVGLGLPRMSLGAERAGASMASSSATGSLVGSAILPPSRINLTTEGTSDWAHWGLTAPTSFDQKANVVSQIPTFSNLAGGTLGQTTLPAIFSWSDGTPDAASTGTSTAVSLKGNGQGFGLTLPADLTSRTVHLYVAVSSGQANLTASLSDGSAAPYSDSSMASFFGNRIQEYTLTYQAASSGQSLHIAFTLLNNYGAGTLSLAAASMSGGGPPAATSTATPTATAATSTATATSTPTSAGVPNVMVDTDMITSVDDVGALAIVNSLANQGKAKLVGVVVNAEVTGHPHISTVGCVDAIDTYYGNSVPIGATGPFTTTTVPPDFVTPCAAFPETFHYSQASPPPTTLQVYRQTLAAQPDSSVVIVEIGFEGNLFALLNSPADQYSSLNGHDLIVKKVKMLMVMGGGYPTYPPPMGLSEHNFRGDPNAAINVANNWPTKVVYSGYELGQDIKTGQNLCHTAPMTSPVLKAYTTYTSNVACKYYFSWDLTAAYHAIMGSADPVMTETPPGSNVIASDGSDFWDTTTNHNRYYLTAASHQNVADALNLELANNPGSTPTATSTATATATATPVPGTATSTATATGTPVPGTATGTPTRTTTTGGSLVGSAILPPSRINLTTEGTSDWAHWGLTAPTSFDHKANVVSQIPTFSNLAGGTLGQTTLPAIFSWSDGTPDTASTGTSTAVSLKGNGQGFGLTLPADLTSRTLHLYVAVSSGQANLTASLSDGSAAPYSDSSMASFFGNRVQEYTLTYQAASSGQSLNLRFTLLNNYGAGTISLAAASLSGGGPPAATSTATATATAGGSGATSTATATGTPVPGTATGTATGTPVPGTATGTPTTTTGTGGSLVGSAILPPSRINLTSEGTTDWAHWGLTAPTSFDHKANVVSQIPTFSNLAGGTLGQTTLPAIFSWSDGTPDAASTGTSTAVSLKGNGQGFGLTLPADLTARTVHLYVAVSSGQANLTASLSDGSAAPYSDSSMTSFFGNRIQEYTLTYRAGLPGQSLHLAFTLLNNYGAGTLSLAAVTLE